jgi:glycosyltransferase involved in cell wall biosynthesis
MTQTREVDEVIVVDDGSTDDSAAIAERLGAKCIRMPRNSGPGAARNRGIAEARGEVIAFLDADDYWGRWHCEDVVVLLERHPECAVAFSRIRRFDATGETLSPAYLQENVATPLLWHLFRDNVVPQSTAVVRRAILLQHGGYDESRRHSEDYELWLRLAHDHTFVCTHTVTANYRLHAGQATRELERMLAGRWEVKHDLWQEATERESRAFVEQLEASLLSVWTATLKGAWWERDERLFRAALGLHDLIPQGAPTLRRWQRRYKLSWRAWLLLSRTWERMPGLAKDLARPVLSAIFSRPGGDLP